MREDVEVAGQFDPAEAAGEAAEEQDGVDPDARAPGEGKRKGQPGEVRRRYSPFPGFGVKYFSYLPFTSFQSSASGGGVPLRVMFGHFAE